MQKLRQPIREQLMYPTLYPDRQADHDACCNAAKWAHSLCVYVCNPWPTFLHLDVTPLHMPPAQHALKLMWISWAQRKITFAVSVNTGVKGSLLFFDIAKAVLFLLLCRVFFPTLSSSQKQAAFFHESWLFCLVWAVMKHPSVHSIDLFVAETIYVSNILFISDKYIMTW